MKTQSEQVQRWDDIIFEKRNKEYGAYSIRKSYNENVLKAEAISIGIGVLIFVIPILMSEDKKTYNPVAKDPEKPIVLENVKIKPDNPPAPRQPVRRMNASVIPTRVTTEVVPDEPVKEPTNNEVTYTTGPENGVESGTENPVSTGTGTIPVEAPAPPPYVLAPEVMPSFEGGMEGMMKFIQKKMRYPRRAQENHEQGIVYVSFIINSAGKVIDVEVIKGFNKDCDKEAVRVISMMDKWKPGLQNKMPVAVKMVLPIKFQLASS